MTDILARYGRYFLYTYTVILMLGIGLGLGLTAALARREGDETRGWLDGALAAGVGSLLLGRVVFVWLNNAYFAENAAETWQIWLGGLNYHGALFGALAGLWLWARASGRSFYRYAGLFAPGLTLLAASGWAACRFEGCAFGRPPTSQSLDLPISQILTLLTAQLPDNLGVFAARYRTQFFGMLGSLAVFAVALWAFGRAQPARLFWGTLGGLSLVRAAVAFGRGDPAPVVAGLRLDLLVDLALAAVSLLTLMVYWLTRRHARS